jgi:hypothetical protein
MITVQRVAIASAILALFAICVIADAAPSCTPPQGMVSVPLKQVPSIVLQTIMDDVGEIAAPMGRFDRTDVMMVGRNRRFAFFWKAANKWIVATEHGGFSCSNPIFLYHLGEDERSAVLMAQKIAFPNTVCTVASDLQASL